MTEQELLLTDILHCQRIDLYTEPRPLTREQHVRLESMRQRRAAGEPVQYILGMCEFMGLPLHVERGVFIPRPETELLVENAIQCVRELEERPLRILDIGTGSGNIAISLAHFIDHCTVTTVDISLLAQTCAQKNARYHGLENKIRFIQTSMYDYLNASFLESPFFDMIVSNPPYIPSPDLKTLPVEVQREPTSALDGGEDGLKFLRFIISASHVFLNPGGYLLLEIGDRQRNDVDAVFHKTGAYQSVVCKKDYAGIDRIVIAKTKSNLKLT